jgi:hypothetical protein
MRSLFRLEVKEFLLFSVNTLFNGHDTLADSAWELGMQACCAQTYVIPLKLKIKKLN